MRSHDAVRRCLALALVAGVALAVAGCAERQYPLTNTTRKGGEGISQKGAVPPVGERRAFTNTAGENLRTGQVGVNGYLWRAALDTVSFMPLASADPYGGVIITDWYTPPETPDERFKVNVLVRGSELKSDGVKVNVFRQKKGADGDWSDARIDQNTQVDMENIILSQARVLRNEARNATK